MTLYTLTDVRELMRHLPQDRRARPTWRHVQATLANATRGDEDPLDVSIALRLALMLDRVECRPKWNRAASRRRGLLRLREVIEERASGKFFEEHAQADQPVVLRSNDFKK
jgi:hypothetical protein